MPARPRQPLLGSLLLAVLLLPVAASSANWRFAEADRIVAVGDVHGAYASLVRTLQNAEVLDADAAWSGGSTQLVITGDMLDRGPDSRKVMDLLMRLEGESATAGGKVHVLLGNHEVMNLTGDLRYVAAAEYQAFAADELPADRERAFERFRATRAQTQDPEALKRDFELRAPPGYFGHRRAFAPDGRYGKWLLGKPLVIVIGDTAFVHGGLSPLAAKLGLDGINLELKAQVSRYAEQLHVVTEAGLLEPTENFYRHAELLAALPQDNGRTAEIKQAIADVLNLNAAGVHETDSPVWYRGNVGCSALIENDRLGAALEALGAKRVVIGHTPTPGRQVLQRLDGRVIEIDTGMLTASYGGKGNALIIEGGGMSVVNESGKDVKEPMPHPRPAAWEAGTLTAAELERLLADADILGSSKDHSGRTIVKLQNGSNDIAAVFVKNPRKDFAPDLAAYRLDRLLELDMVPVTVAREFDGDEGTLQLYAANAKNETQRGQAGAGAGAWCPLPDQWNAMYIFDALAYNATRHPRSIQYSPANWQLMIVDHEKTFAAKSGKPDWLKKADLVIGDAWVRALSSLTDDVLQEQLGDVLDNRRLQALAKRRDSLLEAASAP